MENGKRVEERGDAVRRDRIGEKVIAGDEMEWGRQIEQKFGVRWKGMEQRERGEWRAGREIVGRGELWENMTF